MPAHDLKCLRAFRIALHDCFHHRADALFELVDALLAAGPVTSLQHSSLQAIHRRRWSSLYDALAERHLDVAALRTLLTRRLASDEHPVDTIDRSVWPRCDVEASPERGFFYHPFRHSAGQPMVAGCASQWPARLTCTRDSWTTPRDVRRVPPIANAVAAEQITDLLGRLAPGGAPPLIIYPTFYTTRLTAIGWAAGHAFLLLAIMLTNLDMARQLIPFVRLDGYWLLSDLTGIPDLFTQMRSFTRNAATLSLRDARKAANLKPWAEKVFLAYLLVTIPILTFLAAFFIIRVPGLVENILHSLTLKFDAVVVANSAGEKTYMALGITEMLLLVLQLFGIAYMLFRYGRQIAGVLWRGVRHPAPLIQASSVVGAVALAFFLMRVWFL